MNRNNETFSQAPTIRMKRSKIPMRQNIKTTFNAAYIIPFFNYQDILPGDTFDLSYSIVIRQTTAQTPTMDNAYIDIYFFADPWRLDWDHTKNFFGENTQGPWANTTEYTIPYMITPEGGAVKGTIMDYMGIPLGISGLEFNALLPRMYVYVYNEYFRDQNLIAPATHYTDDTTRVASNSVTELGGIPFKAAKFHDYMTSCTPSPQKGEATTIPLGISAPVLGDGKNLGFKSIGDGGAQYFGLAKGVTEGQDASLHLDMAAYNQITSPTNYGTTAGYDTANSRGVGVTDIAEASGLFADLSQAVAATVNAQRFSFATQRILERSARGGTRYREVIKAAYGVTSPDARQQIPEYLGGERFPLQLVSVAQTSETNGNKALGDLAAYGHTSSYKHAFTKSFTEHTCLMGLLVVRTDQSYNQGLNRMWSRRRLYDVYDPALAFLGEQAVLNKELFAQGTEVDNEVYGYQERWAEMRYLPNIITGAFHTTYAQSLDFWHYGVNIGSLPVLGQEWIEETTANIDRTLAVTSEVEDQFLADIQIQINAVRPMPVHSIPGLIDHF